MPPAAAADKKHRASAIRADKAASGARTTGKTANPKRRAWKWAVENRVHLLKRDAVAAAGNLLYSQMSSKITSKSRLTKFVRWVMIATIFEMP